MELDGKTLLYGYWRTDMLAKKNEYDLESPDCETEMESSGKCVTRKMTSQKRLQEYGLAKKEDIDMSVKLDVDEAIQKEEKKEARASTIDIVKEVTEMMEMLPDEIINHPKHYTFGKLRVIPIM